MGYNLTMSLSSKAIREFQEIYQESIGEELTFEEAKIKAEKLLKLITLITKINEK